MEPGFSSACCKPKKAETIYIQVKDSLGFTDFTIGTGEIEFGSLQDTVPTDRIVALQGGWGFFQKQLSGEILLRLTYKAYVEDEEDGEMEMEYVDSDASDDDTSDYEQANGSSGQSRSAKEMDSFMDVLAALLVSEEFQGRVASETGYSRVSEDSSSPEPTESGTRSRNADMSPSESETNSGSSGANISIQH